MSRQVQALVLALLGAATLRISLTDIFLSYVREPMRPLLIASGVLLLALAGWAVWRVADEPDDEAASHRHEGSPGGPAHGHAHGHGHGSRVAWLLLLPVLAIFLVAPPPLGVEAAARDSGVVTTEPAAWPDLPAGDPVEVGLDEYAGRASHESGRPSLEGRRVALVGFASPGAGEGWSLTRFVAACCAADAAAVKVEVRGQPSPGDGQWVEVVGTFPGPAPTDDTGDEVRLPLLDAESVTPVPQPRVPYL